MFDPFNAKLSKKQAPQEINIRLKVEEEVRISEVCAFLARWFLSDDAMLGEHPRDKVLQSMKPDDRVDIQVTEGIRSGEYVRSLIQRT